MRLFTPLQWRCRWSPSRPALLKVLTPDDGQRGPDTQLPLGGARLSIQPAHRLRPLKAEFHPLSYSSRFCKISDFFCFNSIQLSFSAHNKPGSSDTKTCLFLYSLTVVILSLFGHQWAAYVLTNILMLWLDIFTLFGIGVFFSVFF